MGGATNGTASDAEVLASSKAKCFCTATEQIVRQYTETEPNAAVYNSVCVIFDISLGHWHRPTLYLAQLG